MKKEKKNKENFIVKTTKKFRNRYSTSLIEVDSIASKVEVMWDVHTLPLDPYTMFQRFEQVRAKDAWAIARSISGQFVEIWTQYGRGTAAEAREAPRKRVQGAKQASIEVNHIDHRIRTLQLTREYMQ